MIGKTLIAYFSREGGNYVGGNIVNLSVGNTEVAAKMIEKLTGGKLFKIDPVRKYSNDYTACTNEAREELRANARPELRAYPDSLDTYDTIILCYPTGGVPCRCRSGLSLKDMIFRARQFFRYAPMKGVGWGTASAISKSCVPTRAWKKDSQSAAEASKALKMTLPPGLICEELDGR